MKIAIISTMNSGDWGGSEELWYDLVKHIDDNHQYVIYRYSDKIPSYKQSFSINRKIKFKKISFAYKLINKISNFINNKKSIFFKLLDTVIRFFSPYNAISNFDIILINQGGTYDFLHDRFLLNLVKQNHNRNVFLTCHWNTDYGKPYKFKYIEARNYFNCFKAIFFVSNRNKQTTERQLAFNLPNAFLLKNPINSDFEIMPYPKVKNDYILASVARLDVNCKGQDILLETLSKSIWKNRNWKLMIYGSGSDYEYLLSLIEHYKLTDKVYLKGYGSITDIWKKSHLLVLPSLSEGLPLTLIEAMLSGRTAIVTHIAGMPELIDNNDNGFIAESPKDVFLNIALEKAWNVRTTWDIMGEKAKLKALQYYEPNAGEIFFKKIQSIINNTKYD